MARAEDDRVPASDTLPTSDHESASPDRQRPPPSAEAKRKERLRAALQEVRTLRREVSRLRQVQGRTSGVNRDRVQKLVLMSDEDWEFCRRQPGGASPFIRRLIAAFRESPGELPDDDARGQGRAVIAPAEFWEFAEKQKGGGGPFIRRLIRAAMLRDR